MLKSLLLSILMILCGNILIGQSKLSVLENELREVQALGLEFHELDLFEVNDKTIYRQKMDKVLSHAIFLDINERALAKAFAGDFEAIRFVIPWANGQEIVINAIRNQILTETFKVSTQDGEYVNYTNGHFYKGIVENAMHSLASISIFKDEVIAIFSTDQTGNRVLGQMQPQPGVKKAPYVVFDDKDFLVSAGFECQTEDPDLSELVNVNHSVSSDVNGDVNNCLNWYFECEYNMFLENGSIEATVNKMAAIYNEVQIIYNNESIANFVDQIFVWSEPDGYPVGSTAAARNEFVNRRTPIPGNANVAHLISRGAPSSGGIANGIGGFCYDRPYTSGATPHSYSWIQSNFNPFPTYTWTVNVIAHENGHNLGSFHTHGCYWNGNYPNGGSQIDDCGNQSGTGEGAGCYDASDPILPSNGGTVMSYCHINSTGINLLNGFGIQPGNVIRDLVHNGSCTVSCGTTPCPSINGEVTDIECNDEQDGAITLIIFGGTPPYSYLWSTGATTKDITDLGAGQYEVTVTDDSGNCSLVRQFIVEEPTKIAIVGTVTPESSGSDGAVDVEVSGGISPYSYIWSTGETTQDLTGISQGVYGLTVTDGNGCEEMASFFVANEGGCQGLVSDFPYNESFENGLGIFGQGIGDDFDWTVNSGSTTTGRTGPNAAYDGSFYAYTDATGNVQGNIAVLTGCFDFRGLNNPKISFAYHMYGSNIGSLSIEVEDVNSGQSSVVWTESGNKGAFWQTATVNLGAFANKNVELSFVSRTGQGSSDRADIGLDALWVEVGPDCEPPSLVVDTNDATCSDTNDGSAIVLATGGTPPYTYLWSNGQITSTATSLTAGSYGVTVSDAEDCFASTVAIINAPDPLALDFLVTGESSPGAGDGAIDLIVSGGNAPYNYDWSNGSTTEDLFGLSAGIYSVTVLDNQGCDINDFMEVFVGDVGTCNDEGINLPLSLGFEAGLEEFENSGDFDWITNTGGTPTRRTGPNSANEGVFYALAEANGNQSDQAILLSPCLDLSNSIASIDFAYHMYGITIGRLSLEVSENGSSNWMTLWSRSGDQGNHWRNASVSLSAYTNQIVRIRLVAMIGAGSSARSDMAIDGISIISETSDAENEGEPFPINEENEETTDIFGGGQFGGFGWFFGFKDQERSDDIQVIALSPVPAQTTFNLKIASYSEGKGGLMIMDYMGRLVNTHPILIPKGVSNHSVSVEDLSSGLYFLVLEREGRRFIRKFEVID